MENPHHILIFKTNISSVNDIHCVKQSLNNNNQIERWNIDLQDVDCVLRIVSSSLNHTQVIELITDHGYECAELI